MKIRSQKAPLKIRDNLYFKLIITVALKKEIPRDWFVSSRIPVLTIEALKSGALKQRTDSSSGILILITGAGIEASGEAARWIRDNLKPLFVINIGTCGLTSRGQPLKKWIRPHHVVNQNGEILKLDTRLPLPFDEEAVNVDSLLSVSKALSGNILEDWKRYSAIDMECYSQAMIFSGSGISFHSLKFSTDFSDKNTIQDFNANLDQFFHKFIELFSFMDSDPAQLSVVIPVHNRPQTISRAIDSVLSQSLLPAEIIVVDDCSDDGTRDILTSYGEKIKRVFLPHNSGPSRARNEGIKCANTEWVAFLDSDDIWAKDKLSGQIEYIRRYPFYRIIQSEEVWIRNGVRVNPCRHHKKPEGWIWERSLERCLVSPSGVLAHRALLLRYGLFDEGLPVCEDYDLWLRISRHHPVGLDPALSVIKYGGHDDQISKRYPAMDRFRVRSLMRLLEKETDRDFREKIIKVLEHKLKILIKGYEKRKRWKEAEEYRGMLKSINGDTELV